DTMQSNGPLIERRQKLLGGLEARRADSLPGQILLHRVEHCPFVVYQRSTDMISHPPIVASKDAKNVVRLKVRAAAAALLLNTLKIAFCKFEPRLEAEAASWGSRD